MKLRSLLRSQWKRVSVYKNGLIAAGLIVFLLAFGYATYSQSNPNQLMGALGTITDFDNLNDPVDAELSAHRQEFANWVIFEMGPQLAEWQDDADAARDIAETYSDDKDIVEAQHEIALDALEPVEALLVTMATEVAAAQLVLEELDGAHDALVAALAPQEEIDLADDRRDAARAYYLVIYGLQFAIETDFKASIEEDIQTIEDLLYNLKDTSIQLKVENWAAQTISGLNQQNFAMIDANGQAVSSGKFTVEEETDHYLIHTTSADGAMFNVTVKISGYVSKTVTRLAASVSPSTRYKTSLEAAYKVSVFDAETSARIDTATVRVDEYNCPFYSNGQYFCMLPVTMSGRPSISVQAPKYLEITERFVGTRDSDADPQDQYVFTLSEDPNYAESLQACSSLELSTDDVKVGSGEKEVEVTIEVESEDSEWEGKLIVLKNDREIEEDTVRGRSDEETYDVSVEAGDVITAYIENDVSDCFDTLVFTGGESVGRDNGGSSGGGSGSDVQCSHPFVDVPRNIWYENLMCTLYNWRDVIRGKTPTVAAPADAMTRAEFATVLLRMYELEELPFTKNYFNDVQSGAWYYEEMNVAVEQGLMEVPYNKLGRPNSPATRAEMLVMWARLNNVATSHRLSGTGLCPDMNDSHFAAYAFAYASELELDVDVSGKSTVITGDDATGKCRPDDRANRAEASAIALRGYIATEGSDDIDADLLNLLD